MIFATLAAGVLSFVAGIYYLCRGKKRLGAFLMAVPVLFFAALYLFGGGSSPEAVGGF